MRPSTFVEAAAGFAANRRSMTSAAAPQLSAPTNGRKPSRSAVAAAEGISLAQQRLDEVAGRAVAADEVQRRVAGLRVDVGRRARVRLERGEELSLLIGPPLVKYSRRGDIVVAMRGGRVTE